MDVHDLPTPALVVDVDVLDANIDAMAAVRPGPALRPHVKAFKSTALARHVAERGGHRSFCCATLREVEGMADAGLGEDLLLANETLDADRLRRLVDRGDARITVAVDSPETVEIAAAAGADVLVDVDVGLPRCGCRPEDAGRLAELARARGLEVRGVMGYEGHVVGNPDRERRAELVGAAMDLLRRAHTDVGGDITSAGGTGTYDLHDWAAEVQAGSYLLMDTHYARLGLPFGHALRLEVTVLSTSPTRGWGVVDCGLKSLGMDHGNPTIPGWNVFFCSDEHTTFTPPGVEDGGDGDGGLPGVGDRLGVLPAHVDPTVAYHERLHLVRGDEVVDTWDVDLRGW
ncbi:alanine racemase [Dermatobacter hominis]|uniref:alanine racemase n=1 Tax=Dermatobacter hominis TaxID=2884263 RepID=UPI001D116915|nr:alanine racemase [Dermatobacter hominis]UDY35652.1 alanine racemase [Dermatobacter hominis]